MQGVCYKAHSRRGEPHPIQAVPLIGLGGFASGGRDATGGCNGAVNGEEGHQNTGVDKVAHTFREAHIRAVNVPFQQAMAVRLAT